MNRVGWPVIVVLAAIIVFLTWLLFAIPAPVDRPDTNGKATTTPQVIEPFESENVRITAPLSEERVSRTFTVRGEARGPWYFEASFPVMVRDPQGNVLASTYAQADGEWMTTDFVPFTSNVSITSAYRGLAKLILLKDNPSGLPEHDDSVEIPIIIE